MRERIGKYIVLTILLTPAGAALSACGSGGATRSTLTTGLATEQRRCHEEEARAKTEPGVLGVLCLYKQGRRAP